LISYAINAVAGGKDAMGEVNIKVKVGEQMLTGRGVSTDVIVASVKAYLNAINKAVYRNEKKSGEKQPSL